MNNRTTAIIITVVVALICACLPVCAGVVGLVDWMWGEDWLGFGENIAYFGGAGLCLGILGIVVAVVVGIFTLRKKSDEELPDDEPLPPTY